jgi:hypothetical protein
MFFLTFVIKGPNDVSDGGHYLIKKFIQLFKKPTKRETIRLRDYLNLDVYIDWKKTEFPKECCI